MIRIGVNWLMFLLVPAHPGSSGQTDVKRLLLLLLCNRWEWSTMTCGLLFDRYWLAKTGTRWCLTRSSLRVESTEAACYTVSISLFSFYSATVSSSSLVANVYSIDKISSVLLPIKRLMTDVFSALIINILTYLLRLHCNHANRLSVSAFGQ